MEIGSLRKRLPDVGNGACHALCVRARTNHDEAITVCKLNLFTDTLVAHLPAQQFRGFTKKRMIQRSEAADSDIHARGIDRSLDSGGERIYLLLTRRRARHREHQRRSLSEFFDVLNWPGAVGKIGQRI